MMDGWVEPEYSDDILIAVGRLALSFAALDIGLAMALAHPSEEDFAKVCGKTLSTKLECVKKKRKRREGLKTVPIDRIRELATIRNDLLHGLSFISVYPSTGQISSWNPCRGRFSDGMTPANLDEISQEVDGIVKQLPLKPKQVS